MVIARFNHVPKSTLLMNMALFRSNSKCNSFEHRMFVDRTFSGYGAALRPVTVLARRGSPISD